MGMDSVYLSTPVDSGYRCVWFIVTWSIPSPREYDIGWFCFVCNWNAHPDRCFNSGSLTAGAARRTTWFLRKGRSQLENLMAVNIGRFDNILLRWRRRHTLALCSSREPLV